MSESDASTPSPPAKRKTNGQFQKGLCPNPKGRPKGALAQKTKFLQVMTAGRQAKALKVLDLTLRDAENGDADARELVLKLLQPFIKREAERDAPPGDKRPLVNVIVNQTEGRVAAPAPAVRVIDVK